MYISRGVRLYIKKNIVICLKIFFLYLNKQLCWISPGFSLFAIYFPRNFNQKFNSTQVIGSCFRFFIFILSVTWDN